nr:hypothetical protein [Streptomyces sp. CHD11]
MLGRISRGSSRFLIVPLTVDPLIALDNAAALSCTFQLSPPK